jgi:hypothetical protein
MEIVRMLLILFCQVHDEGLIIVVVVKVVSEEMSWNLPLILHVIKNEVVSFFVFVISSAILSCPWLSGNRIVIVLIVIIGGHLVSNTFQLLTMVPVVTWDHAWVNQCAMLNYSHSRNPRCAPIRTHGQIQAPREPPN